ncbi:hypothetical protein OPAG_07209 [Rhodococcus opacus PD630]|nr:hypothetical protein OPAG_07209 [Rhodococcus opacus PD630]
MLLPILRTAARDHERHDADKDHDGDDFHSRRLPNSPTSYAGLPLCRRMRRREVQWDNRKRERRHVGGDVGVRGAPPPLTPWGNVRVLHG